MIMMVPGMKKVQNDEHIKYFGSYFMYFLVSFLFWQEMFVLYSSAIQKFNLS